MPISSSDAAQVEPQACVAVESTARYVKGEPSTSLGAVRHSERGRATAAQGANALYPYPWLIERISQTFFQEWIGAWNVPTKIDHAEWLCTMCGEYTATWETRSGSYCKYCWSLERTSPLRPVPGYLKELIPHDAM
jgi:hypothetical protein